MEAQTLSNDIGSVSPEWLQSDDSFSFNAFGDVDVLMADLPDFAATPPHPRPHARRPRLAPRPQDCPCFQRLMMTNCSDYRTKTKAKTRKNQQIHR